MLLEQLSSVIPNNVLGKLIGKFYAELAKGITTELQKLDPKVTTWATVNFDAAQFNMMFFLTFDERKDQVPTMGKLTSNLLKQLKLKGVKIVREIDREDKYSWSYDFSVDFADRIHKASDLDVLSDNAAAAFKANIDDFDYQLNT